MLIQKWGVVPYREAWERQKELFRELIENKEGEEYLIICQHPHVYTVGFHGNDSNMLADKETLRSIGAEMVRIERGGDITYHGPGQLIVYPVISLNRHGLGVRKYVETLEDSVRSVLEEYGIRTTRNDEQIGVWLDWDLNPRKICAIGVKISHGVTMHGLALNVNTELSYFGLINPCGITDKGVTSMAREKGRTLDIDEVGDRLAACIIDRLGPATN